jgi:hypothetical protein
MFMWMLHDKVEKMVKDQNDKLEKITRDERSKSLCECYMINLKR